MKAKTIEKLIIIVIVLIFILGGIFAYLYFATDVLKTNAQLFFKYLGQMVDEQDGFIDNQLTEYSKKKYTGKYEDSGKFYMDVNISGMDSETLQTLNDFNIEYSGKVDNTTRKNEQDISLNYSSDVNFPFKYKYADETLGLQTDYVSSKYVGIENRNLKQFIEKFGVTDTTEFPDTIDFFSNFTNQETITYTNEEREQIINTYKSILEGKLGQKEFTKTKENNTESYSVEITNQELKDLVLNVLETLKNDQILMPKMEEATKEIIENMNVNSTEEITIQNIIQGIIDDINASEIDEGTNIITVSQIDKKLSSIAIKNDQTELKITKTNTQGTLTYGIEINMLDVETQESMRYFLTASYQGLEQLASVNETYQYGLVGTMNGQEQKMVYNLNCTDTFNDGITIADYAEDEIQKLNEYDAEQIVTLITSIVERIGQVNTMQMEEIGFSEYGNPLLFASPLTSLSMLIYNQASDVVNESSMSEVEMEAFNQRFMQYEGEQSGTTVRALLQTVISNNVGETDENRKIEVSGDITLTKEDTKVPTEDVNTGSMYNVQMQYNDEGIISQIIITEQ